MNIKVTIVLSCFIFILFGCSTRRCPENRISFIIDSLIKASSYSEKYKEEELNNKKRLLDKICGKVEGKGKIIFFEYASTVDFLRHGAIFNYWDNDIYTYELDNGSIKIAKDDRYDKRQIYKGSFSYYKDSTLEKLIIQSNRKLTDANTFRVYYLDFTKNDFRLILID